MRGQGQAGGGTARHGAVALACLVLALGIGAQVRAQGPGDADLPAPVTDAADAAQAADERLPGEVPGQAPGPPPPAIAGAYEVLEEPGFVVYYQNCDGTLPTADRLTLPRPLSSRYTAMSATVRTSLAEGKPILIQLIEGDAPLFEAIQWHVERARFAAGPPACVLLHYQVADTVLKAAEIIDFRVWVDVSLAPDGQVLTATVADELADDTLRAAILRQVSSWKLEPWMYQGEAVSVDTSLRVGVHMEPSGWTSYDLSTRLIRRGPRPVKAKLPGFPRRLTLIAHRGSVLLEFMVSEDGKPIDPQVVDSQPKGVFDQEALGAIRRWRYKPVVINGKPVTAGPVRQVINFDSGMRPEEQPSVPRGGISVGG